MTATTTEDITVESVSLKTYAKNIETLGATLRAPSKRGANAQSAMRSGGLWTPYKPHDEGNMVWPMWVVGTDDNGAIPSGTERTWFYTRVDELTALFDKPHGLLDIRHTLPDASIRQAFCECVGILDFTTQGANPIGKVQVELGIPGSYWQDVNNTAPAKNTTVGSAWTFATGGTAPMDDATYTIDGPITNPRITDEYTGAYVQYNGALTAGQQLVLNASTFAVTATGITPNLANLVMVGTAGRLMRLVPDASLRYRPILSGSGTAAGVGLTIVGKRKFLVG
jgi:hypothetical protein